MKPKLRTCLWFDDQGEEAAGTHYIDAIRIYVSSRGASLYRVVPTR